MFEKLAGFAIKAKDNALSKTILSKDKRLEQSISENIRVEDILLKKVHKKESETRVLLIRKGE